MKDKSKTIDPIKKAKRRKFWFGFLRVVLIIAVVIAVMKLVDVLVEKTIKNADPSYFVFSNGEDNLQHVTADFKVPLKMKSKNGKYHKVKWTENSPYASIDKEGNVSIKLPEEKNVKLVLWENYGWFIFKGKRQYVLDLVTSNVQQFGNEADIPVDKVINGTYHRDMDIAFDADDNVAYVYGDFGNTKLYNEDDILAYIEHNRQILNIPEELEIKENSYSTSKIINTCNLDLYYDGVRVDDDIIVVAVSNEDYKPVKVTCDITRDFSTLNENIELDMEACREALEAKYEISPLYVSELETVIVDNKYCSLVIAGTDGYIPAEICIDKNSLEIIYECEAKAETIFSHQRMTKNNTNQLEEINLEKVKLIGITEDNRRVEFDGVTDGELTYMYDSTRNIKVYQCMNDKMNPLIKEETLVNLFLPGLSNILYLMSTDSPLTLVNYIDNVYDPSYAVEVELFNQAQNAYDYYYRTFGWYSYDNKGSGFDIYTNIEGIYCLGEKTEAMDSDGLAWVDHRNAIFSTQKYDFLTSPGVDPVAISHEYSHGVLNNLINNSKSSLDGRALHEAFGDVMGICSNHDINWKVGEVEASDIFMDTHPRMGTNRNLCIRDLKDPKGGRRYEILNKKAPVYYEDSIYNDKSGAVDEHDRGLLLGNIAYKMRESDEFTQDEIANLWYKAVSFGFDKEVSFPRFRTNLIEAIDQTYKVRKEEKIELVEKLFDEKHIYDESYYSLTNRVNRDKGRISKIISAKNDSIEGNPVLDDSVSNYYYIFYSPISFMLSDTYVFIVETPGDSLPKHDKSAKEIGEQIETMINQDSQLKRDHENLLEAKRELSQVWDALKVLLGKDNGNSATVDEDSEINVIYVQAPKIIMDAIIKANEDKGVQVKESLLDLVTDDPDSTFWNKVVNFVWRLMFHDEYYETTAYDFYNSL